MEPFRLSNWPPAASRDRSTIAATFQGYFEAASRRHMQPWLISDPTPISCRPGLGPEED